MLQISRNLTHVIMTFTCCCIVFKYFYLCFNVSSTSVAVKFHLFLTAVSIFSMCSLHWSLKLILKRVKKAHVPVL